MYLVRKRINHPLDEARGPSVDASSISDFSSSDDPSLEKFAALALSPTQEDAALSNPERAKQLRALPCCEKVKKIGAESMEAWGKSFELTEQPLLFQDLEPLESLKKKTNNHLIQSQFEAVVNFSKSVKSSYANFQALRRRFDDLASAKDTTVPQQVEAIMKLKKELQNNGTMLGKNADVILDCGSKIFEFQQESVKETQNKIDSRISTECDQQEDIQFTLDWFKDAERMAPKIKVEPSGLASTFLEGVGKFGFLKLAKRYKRKLLGSKMIQNTHEAEKSKANALDRRLEESRDSLSRAHTAWLDMDQHVYMNTFIVIDEAIRGDTTVPSVTIANGLDEAEGKLLTLIELIDDFLAEITKDYGVEFITREAKRVCSRVPNIFTALELLLSAKEVVVSDHQNSYEEHIRDLCKLILEHFKKMKAVHWEHNADASAECQTAFLKDDVPKFQNNVYPHLKAITEIAQAHVSKSKSKEAYKKRVKDDGYHGDSGWARPGRALVTSEEISWALYKVIDALLLIQVISSAPSGPASSGETTGGAEGSTGNDSQPEWFRMPREIRNQFYAVLFAEAQKLRSLSERRNEKSKSSEGAAGGDRLSRLRRLMTSTKHSPSVILVH